MTTPTILLVVIGLLIIVRIIQETLNNRAIKQRLDMLIDLLLELDKQKC